MCLQLRQMPFVLTVVALIVCVCSCDGSIRVHCTGKVWHHWCQGHCDGSSRVHCTASASATCHGTQAEEGSEG